MLATFAPAAFPISTYRMVVALAMILCVSSTTKGIALLSSVASARMVITFLFNRINVSLNSQVVFI